MGDTSVAGFDGRRLEIFVGVVSLYFESGVESVVMIFGSNTFLRMLGMDEIIELLRNFRDERNWEQFHQPKDLALALSIEASELLEVYLWKKSEDASLERVKEELADVFSYAFLLADAYQLDVKDIVQNKIKKNAAKYPVDKAKGIAKKYTEL